MAERPKKKYTILRDNKPNLLFTGIYLGSGSDEHRKVTLYKTDSEKYVAEIETKPSSIFEFPNEEGRFALVALSLEELLALIKQSIGIYSQAAKAAFFEASDVEPTLRKFAVEEI